MQWRPPKNLKIFQGAVHWHFCQLDVGYLKETALYQSCQIISHSCLVKIIFFQGVHQEWDSAPSMGHIEEPENGGHNFLHVPSQ